MKQRTITLALIVFGFFFVLKGPSFAQEYLGAATSAAEHLFHRGNAAGMAVAPPTVPAQAGAAPNEHNVDLLARLVRAEAEGEPYEGKVAVAAVMLNRTRDSRFPNTLEGVVFETDAFESVSNGRIYETPPADEDYRAARDALNGWDPSYGCVFFWNPATATSPWVWSRPIATQIGTHVFAN